ncbi:MAG: hypothetical protein ACOZBL_00850 [Patescibacteria group bacterium]
MNFFEFSNFPKLFSHFSTFGFVLSFQFSVGIATGHFGSDGLRAFSSDHSAGAAHAEASAHSFGASACAVSHSDFGASAVLSQPFVFKYFETCHFNTFSFQFTTLPYQINFKYN